MFPCKEIVDARPKVENGRGSRRRQLVRNFADEEACCSARDRVGGRGGPVWVVLRIQLAKRVAVVPELLPQETLLLVEVPDFQRTRTHWHASDLYQIWREPSVQAWLQKPLARLPKDRGGRKTLEDFLQLGPTCGFLALTSVMLNQR
jgi:hypothetical protein